jgi:hypothetical protein
MTCLAILIDYRTGPLVTTASPSTKVFAQNPFLAVSTSIANVYSEAIRQNMEYLTVSSARIIQEQTIKAWADAAQSCGKALAANMMSGQQKALERMADANQKAFGILAWDLSPFKMQAMNPFTSWFPTMTDMAAASKPASRRAR